jgi:hypothetical protein
MVRRTDSAEPILRGAGDVERPVSHARGLARGRGQRRDSDEVSGPDGSMGRALGRHAALSLGRADDAPT